MRPAEKLPPPYTLWRCCRFIRPRHWRTCTRVGMTQKFLKSFVPLLTSCYEWRRSLRGLWAMRRPLWLSRNAISGCVWPPWGRLTRCGSWMPSSSPLHRSRLRPSNTPCPGMHLLPPPGHQQQHLSLLVAEGGPMLPHFRTANAEAGRQQPPAKQRREASRRTAAPPVQAPTFVYFFPATDLTVGGTQNLVKGAVSSISGSPEGTEL